MRMIVSHPRFGRIALLPIASLLVLGAFTVSTPARAAPRGQVPVPVTAYVVNRVSGDVTPIDVATGAPGSPIDVGAFPNAVAFTPDGATAYVVNNGSNNVTPIDVATGAAGPQIPVGDYPLGIAITPDGATAYVTNYFDNSVTPIVVATGMPGAEIIVGQYPFGVAVTPDGETAYVAAYIDNTLVPIDVATNSAGAPIHLPGLTAYQVAITPDGSTAYVTDYVGGAVIPIDLASRTPGTPIPVDPGPRGLAITPDGSTIYVTSVLHSVSLIDIATNTTEPSIATGATTYNIDLAISPDGVTAYVVNQGVDTVTPIDIATGTPSPVIGVGTYPVAVAITPTASHPPRPPSPPHLTFGFGASTQGKGRIRSHPVGINCGRICAATFDDGATVTLRAIPRDGWLLARWRFGCSGHRRVCTLEMSKDRNVKAIFVRR